MTEVSKINAAIRSFLANNAELKSLPKSKILTIMVMQGVISHSDASEYLKNSTFDTGYASNIQVIPAWEADKKAFDESLAVLNATAVSARQKLADQDNYDGFFARTFNSIKENFNLENKKSDSENEILRIEKEISELEKAESPEDFKAKFKKLRGVEFSSAKVQDCARKAEIFNNAENIKGVVDGIKSKLSTASFNELNSGIVQAFQALGIEDESQINEILKDIESSHKGSETIQKFGGDFEFGKNYYGNTILKSTNNRGKTVPANTEQLKLIAEEMELRLNRAAAAAMGIEISETATSKEIENLIDTKYSTLKGEYNKSFESAYGKRNIETMADNYIKSQKQGAGYAQTTLDIISLATMFMGSGLILKGASLLSKGGTVLRATTAATNAASKVVPAAIAVQVTRPVELTENLTSKEPDWKAYGMSVAEGAMWMALGMATGVVGDKARLFLGQKGLSQVAKNTGKSVTELIDLYKSGHKLPANLGKYLGLIENASKASGMGAEFTADVIATYAIQASRGEDMTLMDYIGSANGALMGTVMHKTFANISDAEKVKVIQKGLLESNPNMSKEELEKASKALLDVHRLAEEKRAKETSKVTDTSTPAKANETTEPAKVAETAAPVKAAETTESSKTGEATETAKASKTAEVEASKEVSLTRESVNAKGEKILVLNEEGEAMARASAAEIHEKAVKAEAGIVNLMEKAGLGKSGVNMTHRPKSAQSLYDKIRNALTDIKSPATFKDAIKSVRDAVGTRTELGDFDYKKHPDIVEMYKKDPKKAIQMAAERQSEEYVAKVKEIIRLQAEDPNSAALGAINISNYMGKDGIPYFSEKQVAVLRDYAAQFGIELNVKNKLTKVRPSGYTALQMNFVTKDGFIFEWQLRGSKVNKFAECEHVPYDIREGKDVTGGNPLLKELYSPIENAVKALSPEKYDLYNEYLTAHYEHLRKLELGFESTPPKLEDFGLTDPKLKAENLELLHELSDGLKKGKIDKQTALLKYFVKTEKAVNIPSGKLSAEDIHLEKGYVLDQKTNKPVKVDLDKIKVNTNEYLNSGSISIEDEFGNILGNVTFDVRNNKSGEPCIYFEGLVSNVQGIGIGTKLIKELEKISNAHGFGGRLIATASPMKGLNGKLTNIEFYYKQGFKAVSPEKHVMIEECLKQNKEIPLALNLFTDIEYIPN